MSMKKIIAGVAAAALTVGSLAVVGVSAEAETKTFSFVGKTGSMTVNYSQTINIRGGVDVDEIFDLGEMKAYDFVYALEMSLDGSNYNDNNLAALNKDIFENIKLGKGTTITVTGVNSLGRAVTAKATATFADASHNTDQGNGNFKAAYERIVIRDETDNGSAYLQGYELDLSNIVTINSISVSNTFEFSTGKYSVPAGVGGVQVKNATWVADSLASQLGGTLDFSNWWCSYTSKTEDNDGKVIEVGVPYAFEGGTYSDGTTDYSEIGADQYGRPIYAVSLGANTLRWVNDNIIQNKGAKLRINFMTPKQLSDAITVGGIDTYPTLINTSVSVLNPGGTAGAGAYNDITIGVNLKNTTKLQQTTNIVDYTAEFDWDTLVQNSASTVSGNVDSIAFRIQSTDNTRKTVEKDGKVGIKSIEIVIPDQASVPGGNDPARVITAGSADTFVKLIGTEKTIYGNGATEVAVENNITNNNVSYAVKLMDATGAYVQPAGEVTLQLSIPTDFRGATLTSNKVRHTCNDGTVEELDIQNFETYKTDNYIVVKTSKFSDFSFGFETTEADTEPVTEAPVTEAPVTEAPVTEAPSTGNTSNGASADKNAPTGVVLAVVPAAVAAAAVVISKKRK